jgi:hypothetical protein
MGKIEDSIQRQIEGAAARIWKRWPDECKIQMERWCTDCIWFHKRVDQDENGNSHIIVNCEHGLAPLTSAKLPCPYYRLH